MLLDENDLTSCSLSYVFSVIDGKWKPFIIWYLYKAPEGFCRYGELKRNIPWKISNKMFTQQLKELEDANIITRTEYDEKPLRVEYRLTESGKLLAPAILYLRDWGAAFGKRWTKEDLLERTLGDYRNGTLHYGHESEELNGKVEISFRYKFE